MNLKETIQVLEKRAEFLASRIANSDKDLTYDKQEHGALRHALGVLVLMREQKHAHRRKEIEPGGAISQN